jgi:tetratricopeptide (TPR) repeat protein
MANLIRSVYPIRALALAMLVAAWLPSAAPAQTVDDDSGAAPSTDLPAGDGEGILDAWEAYGRGDYERARDLFTPLAEDGDPEAAYALGTMESGGLGGPRDPAAAARHYGHAAGAGHAEAASALGYQYDFGIGLPQNRDLAEYWYGKAAEGGSLIGMNNLAYSWIEQGRNLRAALDMIRDVVAAGVIDASTLDTLGWALFQEGAYPESLPPLCQAALIEPGHPEIRLHLGDAYWRAGRMADARRQWQAALELEANPDSLSEGGFDYLNAEPRGEWRAMLAERIARGVPGEARTRGAIGPPGIESSFTDECAIPVG